MPPSLSQILKTLLLTAGVALCLPAPSHAAEKQLTPEEEAMAIDTKKGEWEYLTKYIGTYHYDEVFADPGVKKAIEKMTKGHPVDLKREFSVVTPIGFDGNCLVLRGNPEHMGDTNSAYMDVCMAGYITLGLSDTGKVQIYTDLTNFQYVGEAMREWAITKTITNGDSTKKPDEVQLIIQPK